MYVCVYGIFCKVSTPHQVRISKPSREGDTAKSGPLEGLQLFARLPSPMVITCSGLHTHLPLLISPASRGKCPLFSTSLVKDKAVFFPIIYSPFNLKDASFTVCNASFWEFCTEGRCLIVLSYPYFLLLKICSDTFNYSAVFCHWGGIAELIFVRLLGLTTFMFAPARLLESVTECL